MWPPNGTSLLKFTFGKFKAVGSYSGQHNYVIDTVVENLWSKPFQNAAFSLYVFDKNQVRIGDGWISLTNMAPGETIKFQTNLSSAGTPSSMSLAPRTLPSELSAYLPPSTVSVTVNSVPQGANLKVDGKEAGTTPKQVQVGRGKHVLEFSREGFNTGQFPLEISPEDVSGGSISFELGTAAHDTLELRDCSVITGDLESLSATDVVVRAAGTLQRLNRNQVKRILLVERDMPAQ